MHTYIYDTFLTDKKYFPIINSIEAKITELGLSGRICRLSPLRSLRDVISQELKRLPKTLIIVGNDSIVSQAISIMGGNEVPLGIIPIGEPNNIAARLGINTENSCSILSARRVVDIDLGAVDSKTFLKSAEINGEQLRLMIDNNYYIESSASKVEVVNSFLNEEAGDLPAKSNEDKRQLHLVITKEIIKKSLLKNSRELERSIIPFADLQVVSDNATITLDGFVKITNPHSISVLPRGLKTIVGRERGF